MCLFPFDRYDLDKSGTLNDADELQYLTINVIKAMDIKVSLSVVDQVPHAGLVVLMLSVILVHHRCWNLRSRNLVMVSIGST